MQKKYFVNKYDTYVYLKNFEKTPIQHKNGGGKALSGKRGAAARSK